MKNGIEIIAEERNRQIEVEKYDDSIDSSYINGELATAAATYALRPIFNDRMKDIRGRPILWPWPSEFWKPTPEDRIRELAKAGALIAAEIDRLNKLKK